MKKLLSLPPHVVDCFHSLMQVPRSEYFCTSDPVGHKLGSGGGTVWLLESCRQAEAPDVAFSEWLGREPRILLHAGGQSRRLPAYAPCGKVLTPFPVFRWARGQRIDQHLLDLQLPLYERIMHKAPTSLRTLIASGDVYLRTTEPLQDIPEADVVCYGLWATPEQISHHGVFMIRRDRPGELDFMLQKPSLETQSAYQSTHFSLMDIGVWLLSDRAVLALRRQCDAAPGGNYDLYAQFGCALGSHPSQPDEEIGCLSVAILPLPGGEFYHFGTTEDMLHSSIELQNLVKDQRFIIQKNVKRQPSFFIQNAHLANRPTVANTHVWIENAWMGEGWHYASHHIITGVPVNDWSVRLPEGACVDVVPVGEQQYALRPYGYYDAFRGAVADEGTTYLNRPVAQWLQAHGIAPEALGPTDDLQSARLFPVFSSVEEMGQWLNWMLDAAPDATLGARWTALPRRSAEELSEQANLSRLFAQRQERAVEILPKLATNWTKSIFYQVDLKDMAAHFARHRLALPAPLPEDAPLLTRIHDAMFRAEAERCADHAETARHFADRAFGLLREGLTADALRHKCRPQMTTCADQIVWGRSPVRIDLAGGWTDTPPYCLINGGNVVNAAIELNGQPPLQVYVKPCREPVIICRSIDLGAMERIETYDELQRYVAVGSPFSIPKAALCLCGFAPQFSAETYASLRQQLEAFGSGIEITLLSAVPAGSGLGTSSILSATVLGALSDFCGLGWDRNAICNRTLVLEQLLTTGGGWQDQYGGVLHGVKLLQTTSGFAQNAVTRWLPETLFTNADFRPCHLLYYTGVTRTAKHILTEIVRGMFLNATKHLDLLEQMKQHALSLFDVVQRGNWERYGQLVRETWEQNKALDAGTNPPIIEELCRRVDDYCLGYKLPGAGGGGFMYMVAKDAQAALRIREELTERPLAPNARFVELSLSDQGLQVSRS